MKDDVNINDNTGKYYVRVDFNIGCSPALQCIRNDPIPDGISETLRSEFEQAIDRTLGVEWAWSLDRPEFDITCEKIKPLSVRQEEFATLFRMTPEEHAARDAADEERERALVNHPNNGPISWWRVDGIRHESIVRASSAMEAIEKSEIGDWESPFVEWIGAELPDVIRI